MRRALEKVKDVAAGGDQVPPVSLRGHLKHETGQCEIIAKMTAEFNAILMGAGLPESWKETRLILVYKGHGDHPGCIDSYRGVGIGAASLKVFCLILEERLTEFMEKILTQYQMGFRRDSGTQEAALLLSESVRGSNANLLFIDIVKAYDSVIWPILIEKLIDVGVSPMLVNFIRRLYQEQYQYVEVNGKIIGEVKMGQGLIQGSSLSPLLFNIYINSTILEVIEEGRASAVNGVVTVFFADDGVLLAKDFDSLIKLYGVINRSLENIGLKVNKKKTKWMRFGTGGNITDTILDIDRVYSFRYVGYWLTSDGKWDAAWEDANRLSLMAMHFSVQGGFMKKGSLAHMLLHCKAKIFCHLDRVAAIAGSVGRNSRLYDGVIDKCLKVIAQCAVLNTKALKIEAGMFNVKERADVLMIRLFTKICLIRRGVLFEWLEQSMRTELRSVKKCKSSFANKVINAAKRLKLGEDGIYNMRPHDDLCRVQYWEEGGWVTSTMILSEFKNFGGFKRLRLIPWTGQWENEDFYSANAVVINVEGFVWNEVFRDLMYSAIRSRANRVRQAAAFSIKEKFQKPSHYLNV